MKKFQDWAKREYSIRQRLIALGFEGIFFLLGRLFFGNCANPDTDSRASIIYEASRGERA